MVSIRPDCALLDYRLPDIDGIEVLERLKKNKQVCDIPVAIITGQGSEEVAVQAIKLGAINYLVKGDITDERLVSVALQGVQRGKLKAGIRERMRAKGGQVIDADEYISGAITTIDALVERVQVKSNALKDDPDLAAARSGLAELLRYVRNEKHVQDFS